MDGLATLLRKSGISDLLAFFPNTKRDRLHLEKHFKAHGLNPVVDYYTKKVNAAVKEEVAARLREMMSEEESTEDASRAFASSNFLRYAYPCQHYL
jgi:hypothetical protein